MILSSPYFVLTIFGAPFYTGRCPNAGLEAEVADPVHMVSPKTTFSPWILPAIS